MTDFGKVIKIHEKKREADTQIRSVPVTPSRRHDNVRRIIHDVPPVGVPEPEQEPEKVKVKTGG